MIKLKSRDRSCMLASLRRRAHIVHVASVDVQGSADNDQTDLEVVPLPRPFSDSASSEPQLSTQYTSLDDLPPVDSGERISTSSQGFSLDKTQSLWLLNLVSFVYGTNTTLIKDTIENSHLAPSILCALRYGLAAGLMLPFLLKPGIKKVNWGLSFELGLTLFVAYQCQARELVTESASEGSIMLAVYLLLVPLVELAFGRPFTSKKVASLLVAVGGVALLAAGMAGLFSILQMEGAHLLHTWEHGGGSEASAVATTNTILGLREGTVWGLVSAIAFAVHLVRSEIRQHEAKDVGQLAAAQLIVCGVLSVALLAWTGNHDPLLSPQLSPGVIASQMPWGPFLITLLFGTVLGQSGELVAVAKVPASTASLTLSLVVVWGLFCGAIVSHDRLAPLSWAGAALIVGATIIPKVLDVLADRRGGASEKASEPVQAPTTITSEEFVRTTVSASMLAATPVLSEAGMLGSSTASATSTAASVVTRQVLGAAAEASLSSSGLLGSSAGAAAGGEAAASAVSAGANALASAAGAAAETGGAVTSAVRAASSAANSSGAAAAGGSAAKTAAAAAAASAAAGSAAVSGAASSTAASGAAASAASTVAAAAASSGSAAASGAAASTAAAASSAAAAASTAAASTAATTAAGSAGTSLAAAAAGSAAAAAGGAALVAAGASGGDVSSVISGAADALSSSGSAVIDAASAATGPAIESITSTVTTVVDAVTSTDAVSAAVDAITGTDLSGDPSLLVPGDKLGSAECLDFPIFDALDAAQEAAKVAEESVYGPGADP